MKVISLSLLLISSFSVAMQAEDFSECIKKGIGSFYHLRSTARNYYESERLHITSMEILRADVQECKKKYASDLLQVSDWGPIYQTISKLSYDAHNHIESKEVGFSACSWSIQAELFEFCNRVRNVQEFFKEYVASEKLKN